MTDGATELGSSTGTAVNSPCLIQYACLPLKNALLSGITDPAADTYGYCSANNSAFGGQFLNSCISCLQASSDQVYISNCQYHRHTLLLDTRY